MIVWISFIFLYQKSAVIKITFDRVYKDVHGE